jgi:hypothetical protein
MADAFCKTVAGFVKERPRPNSAGYFQCKFGAQRSAVVSSGFERIGDALQSGFTAASIDRSSTVFMTMGVPLADTLSNNGLGDDLQH